MRRKPFKIILSLALLVAIAGLIFLLRFEITEVYTSWKYSSEIEHVKEILGIIKISEVAKLKKITDSQCRVLRSDFLDTYSKALSKVDFDSLRAKFAKRRSENGSIRFFIIVYFEKNLEKNIHIQLERRDQKWIMVSFAMSEELVKRANL